MLRQGGQRRQGGGGVKARQEREKFSSTVGWSRKSRNIATARKQKQMSHVSHIPHPLPPYPSFCLTSPCSHSPDDLVSIFFFLSPSLLCSLSLPFCFVFPFAFPQTALFSLSVRNCLTTAPARQQPPVGSFHISRSDANHLASEWRYSQHADSTCYSAGPD